MKPIYCLLFSLLLATTLSGQRMDSIAYEHGHLYYHQYGEKGEPVIVLTGGPGANYRQLEEVAVTLGREHRAVLLEQRGTGRSMPQPFDSSTINLETAMADINRLLDHLRWKEAHLLGHSWGGMLAMSFATRYPGRVKSLILVDPGPFRLNDEVFGIYFHNQMARLSAADRAERDSLARKLQAGTNTEEERQSYLRWELIPVFYDRSQVDSLIGKINRGGHTPQMGGLMFQDLFRRGFDLSVPLAAFDRPVHIISGAQDPAGFVSYELKILMPAARLHWIDQAGHFPMYERPEKFYEVLLGVLGR